MRTGGGTSYNFAVTDRHATSLLTLDATAANPVWRQFTPYGAPRGTAPTTWPDNHGFLGKPADPVTGLTIVGARAYDPGLGRFLSADPILNPAATQSLNGYTYGGDNPATNADPTGLMFPAGDGCLGGCPSEGASHHSSGGSPGSGGGTCYYCYYNPSRGGGNPPPPVSPLLMHIERTTALLGTFAPAPANLHLTAAHATPYPATATRPSAATRSAANPSITRRATIRSGAT